MAKLFFEGFRTFLRSIEQWMETAELRESDEVLFIRKKEDDTPLDSLWAEQPEVVKTEAGDLFAPNPSSSLLLEKSSTLGEASIF